MKNAWKNFFCKTFKLYLKYGSALIPIFSHPNICPKPEGAFYCTCDIVLQSFVLHWQAFAWGAIHILIFLDKWDHAICNFLHQIFYLICCEALSMQCILVSLFFTATDLYPIICIITFLLVISALSFFYSRLFLEVKLESET